MTMVSGRFSRRYLTLVGVALLSALVIAALGYVPAVRTTWGGGARSLLGGCSISWIASCAGALPLAVVLSRGPTGNAVTALLAATGVRFLTVLVLVVPAVFSGWFDRVSLVLWVAVSYLLMLAVDTLLAVRIIERLKEKRS